MASTSKARRLRQSNANWYCTSRRARTWIMPKDRSAYRPYVVLVLEEETELIRRVHTQEEQPTPETVLEVLLKAMKGPLLGPLLSPLLGLGRRGRPIRITLDDTDLVRALAPHLAEIGVSCDYKPVLPLVDDTLRRMGARMTKREPIPGLLSVPGATEPLVRELFEAAANYYRQKPWREIDNADPIEVRFPSEGRVRYAVVLGSGGETFGLALYESLDDLLAVFTSSEADQPAKQVSWFSVVFEEATAMGFDDLDAIEEQDWPVAGEWAYPVAIKTIPSGGWGVPSVSEISWLAATLRVIPDFVKRRQSTGRSWPYPVEVTYPLPGVHSGQKIMLRYPVNLFGAEVDTLFELEEDDDITEELEEWIQDWYFDESSHEFAREMGAFLFEFLDYLETTGLSRRTLDKHASNCWLIGKFECDYGYHDTFSPEIFVGEPSFLYEFRRKVSDSKYAIASYQATWRKLAKYVQSSGHGAKTM